MHYFGKKMHKLCFFCIKVRIIIRYTDNRSVLLASFRAFP